MCALALAAGGAALPAVSYPDRLGRWPAAVLLFAFAMLKLAYPNAASPRSLAVAIALYSWVTWLGMATFGSCPVAWCRSASDGAGA